MKKDISCKIFFVECYTTHKYPLFKSIVSGCNKKIIIYE